MNIIRLASKPENEESGLAYFGAGYYDPILGRFMGVDPVAPNPENIHSFNRYAYANNNPYKFVDPDGRNPELLLSSCPTCFSTGFDNPETAYSSRASALGVNLNTVEGKRELAGSMFAEAATLSTVIPVEGAIAAGLSRFALANKVEIAAGKFDYLFGRVTSNSHNVARSNQLALEMKRLGVPDTARGRQMLTDHLNFSANSKGNIVDTFSNKFGSFEVRESLFIEPSGKAAKFQSSFQVLKNGTRRLSSVIPQH